MKMSPKGQLVVPMEIRAKENFKASDRFVAFGVNDGVLFKRVHIPSLRADFESISKEIAKKFRENNIKEKDVREAVKWARRK